MTKPDFINITSKAIPYLTNEKLSDYYDRIQENEFKTNVEFVEKIYGRINDANEKY